ncbi:RNA polymerase sigma factor [Leptospira gomenensis]|uniref:RNA polymerase sigma factor n=1 Tax=Leptospira gomenensis TaxID=2484974 RepID=A0A5F1Y627_9LEPT|nr:RNA polymerase sigma factor [Leptospira gomenensis]TGK28162.1 RNA polymerase sigma factor [Leptospira gomenensis]TGK36984.1 RNA polymerase sigma factor [Leptospira gomenensis]TGK45620.1 RNA polymerase sigma factor [Leptospira gomenensis]TGK59559.1 RNA polymerase sigma factor [Leptospira gomenensis]
MDQKEFTDLIDSTKHIVLSAIKKNLFDEFHDSIDDVVQETYFRAYKSLAANKFRGDSAVSTWLYTIARNESLRMNQKRSRQTALASKLKEKVIQDNAIQEKEAAAASFTDFELKDILAMLPWKYKSVLSLVGEGYKEQQIAEKLSIPEGTVKSRAFRGKQMLKKLFVDK